jgi:hypothetical protein
LYQVTLIRVTDHTLRAGQRIRLAIRKTSGEFQNVVGDSRDKHAGVLPHDQINQHDGEDRQKSQLNKRPKIFFGFVQIV